MAEEAMHPLRRRMVEDMTIRNFDVRTQSRYIRSVRSCCRYCDPQPNELTFEDGRRYQLHLGQSGLAPSSVNGAMVALRFFFRITLNRPEAVDYIPRRPRAATAAGGPHPSRGGAASCIGARVEVAHGAQRGLWRGVAGVGGR